MPRKDKSGPMGYGPKTGRGLGLCNGQQDSGNLNMPGRGFGSGYRHQRGFGRGMGSGRRAGWGCFDQPPTRQEKRSVLEHQATALQNKLDDVKQQLSNFETEETQES